MESFYNESVLGLVRIMESECYHKSPGCWKKRLPKYKQRFDSIVRLREMEYENRGWERLNQGTLPPFGGTTDFYLLVDRFMVRQLKLEEDLD